MGAALLFSQVFGKRSVFGAGDTFGKDNVFGKDSVFGAGSRFGDNNNFGAGRVHATLIWLCTKLVQISFLVTARFVFTKAKR
jgi:hypothetical protein